MNEFESLRFGPACDKAVIRANSEIGIINVQNIDENDEAEWARFERWQTIYYSEIERIMGWSMNETC